MNNYLIVLFFIMFSIQAIGCSGDDIATNTTENTFLPWWESVPPIIIDGDEFYGRSCSVTRVSHATGIESENIIFNVPNRLLTYCAKNEPDKNYLEYDGDYIILHVDRQTVGAGSSTGELYRSADFKSWEEYIGLTWVNGEEYEAWRKVGSTSSQADSRKKVDRN